MHFFMISAEQDHWLWH